MSPTHLHHGVDQAFYLFASPTATPEASSATAFCEVNGESRAKSLCTLFTREYTDANGRPSFHYKATTEISMEEQVLLDESIEMLAVYDDPDPGIYDPSPSHVTLLLAQYAQRAKTWEQLLERRLQDDEHWATSESAEPLSPEMCATDELPTMPVEDRRNSALNLLMLLAQAYYKMLECTISLASWCTDLDLELNHSYFWIVTSITNLLKNHEDLQDFPSTFQPLFPDLYPSTIGNLDWDDMVAPDAEQFLSTVQLYVHSKGIYLPEEGSHAWVFIELFRPGVNNAIDRAGVYYNRMQQYRQRIIGSSPSPPPTSSSTEGKQTMKRTVVELDLVGYNTISDNLEQGLDVTSVAQLNQQIQALIYIGLKAANRSRDQTVVATTGDGAILVFDSATEAHRFAQAVHDATHDRNLTRQQPLAKRVFRIGVASGEIVMLPKPGGGFDIAGTTIARAVRLEAKAQPGGVLIDSATMEALSPNEKGEYGPLQVIAGKRDEVFEAYAWQPNTDGLKDAAFFTQQAKKQARSDAPTESFGRDKRREVLAHFQRLKSNQYVDLIFLLETPIGQRPAETLSLDQQKAQVLKWADENESLDVLLEVLRDLIEPESTVRPR